MQPWDLASLETSFRTLFADVAHGAVTPPTKRGDVLRELEDRYSFDAPRPLEEAVSDVDRIMRGGIIQTTHPRYFGLFNSSVRFSSVVADLMVAAHNPQVGAWFHSPAAVEIEEHTLRFFARCLGMPDDSTAHFTSGGSEANFTGVLSALTRAFPEAREGGVRAIDGQPVFFVSREAHHSFEKIAQQTGLGRAAVRTIESDHRDRLHVDELEIAIAASRGRGERPFLVVGTAGTTATGAIDPLTEIATLCRREGLWFHVDAAWGGAAAVSKTLRPHLAGIELADSITCDAHKWMSVSMGAGMFFTRHAALLPRGFAIDTPYVPPTAGEHGPDFYTLSVQWSRRFIGLKLFLALAELGAEGLARQIEHHAVIAEQLRDRLRESGAVLLNDSPLALVTFAPRDVSSAEEIRAIAADVTTNGNCWISALIRDGKPAALRACINNYQTGEAEVQALVSAVDRALAARSAAD